MQLIGKENSSCKQNILSVPLCMAECKPYHKAEDALKNTEKYHSCPLYSQVPDESQQRTTTFITIGNSLCFCQKHSLNGNYTHQTLFHYCSISSLPFLPKIHMKGVILASLGPDNKVWVVAQNRAGSIQDWSHSAQKEKCCEELQNYGFTGGLYFPTHWEVWSHRAHLTLC